MTDTPKFRREWAGLPDSQPGSALIETLLRLRRETDPAEGDETERGKDIKAAWAIITAGMLFEHLAGWALDHQAGLAARGLKTVPTVSPEVRERSDYKEARAEVDRHQHEVDGARIREKLQEFAVDPETLRRMFVNILRAAPLGTHRKAFTAALGDALSDLEFGKVSPLLAPNRNNRKVSLQEQRLKLAAIGFIHYRREHGKTALAATQEVADAYGVGFETVKSWEHQLRTDDALSVAHTIGDAVGAARLEVELLKSSYRSAVVDEVQVYAGTYGAEALRRAASSFLQALKREGARRP